ncbi:unnamed protein product [Rotaria sp. Silwood1]|nr:unnamed protein product [Rotaria sp. Silwood1]CAF3489110.1 unnamed protein product [Rotaria sp. Silwood1]CAF3505063.1 unnamed protein product [Rotaria sp. Silwood1]CAF3517075.1 unnamed protein product [Rotaria sp. Silwood1]CAF4840721.1 unnamed protein product [Rotaria sp. Silwood1]
MKLNAIAQHRLKHINLLLAHELALIEREHEKNLIAYKNLTTSICRDYDRISNLNQNKISLSIDEIYDEQSQTFDYPKKQLSTSNYLNDKSCSSIISSNYTRSQIDVSIVRNSSKYRRQCSKLERLPPIIKANISNQHKPSTSNLHSMNYFQPTDKRKQSFTETFSSFDKNSSKKTIPEITPIQKEIQSFLESLPTYTGIQCGFDSFGSSSRYSFRSKR